MLKVSRILTAAKPPEGIYLKVPFTEKDAAKAAGARWDGEAKKWYAPNQASLAGPLKQWQDGAIPPPPVIEAPPPEEEVEVDKPYAGIYINVPFAEKGEAKASGARWDGVAKKWYAPSEYAWSTRLQKWQDPRYKPEPMIRVSTEYIKREGYSAFPQTAEMLVPLNAVIIYHKVHQYLNKNNHYRYTLVDGILVPSLDIDIPPPYLDKFVSDERAMQYDKEMRMKAEALSKEHGLKIVRATYYTRD